MYAQIINGIVKNPVPASSQADVGRFFHPNFIVESGGLVTWVSVPDGTLHGATDNGDGTFTNPDVQVEAPLRWDALDFMRRFTQAERIAIRTLAKSNGQAEDFLDLLDKAAATGTYIHSDDPNVLAGLAAFESAGVIGAGRADEILGG